MPLTKKTWRKKTKRKTRVAGLAVRPRLMGRTLATKRFNQVATRIFYFKNNGTIDTTPTGSGYFRWTGQTQIALNDQIQNFLNIYDQYKVLGFKVKLFPANVGIEAHDTLLGGDLTLLRGNHVVWNDQRLDPGAQVPTSISQVINTASARLINARRPYARSIWRPTGKPAWGSTKDINTAPDLWTGSIQHLFTNSTPIPAGASP